MERGTLNGPFIRVHGLALIAPAQDQRHTNAARMSNDFSTYQRLTTDWREKANFFMAVITPDVGLTPKGCI
jgi:hypothetical protein